jgi:glucosamine 6-phosphate synthetase-like amidotransferase/phosphosugar isomerase protein
VCGVFGFVSHDGKGPDVRVLERVATATMQRGPHAWGMAWIDGKGRLRAFKQTGRIVDALGLLAMARDARMLIGHCRWATQGSPAENVNNHPHPADGGWVVHNGTVPNFADLAEAHDMHLVSECDSEVLAQFVERFEGDLVGRCVAAAQMIAPQAVVLMGLWARPGRLVAVKRGNPLHVGMVGNGKRYYLGSLPDGLPGEVLRIRDGEALVFTGRRVRRRTFGAKQAAFWE